jgi:hypothetical protein
VIVSLLYRVSRRLLSVPAVILRRDISKDAELLVRLGHVWSGGRPGGSYSYSDRPVPGPPP